MKYALYGNDIDETTNPLEAGLGWVVKPAKGEFIGRGAIEALRARGRRRASWWASRWRSARCRGTATACSRAARRSASSPPGSFGPSVERSIGMGYVASPQTAVGTASTSRSAAPCTRPAS